MWLVLAALLSSERPPYHIFVTGAPRAVLEWALDGARARLSNARCRQVLGDFADRRGRTLAERVAAVAKPPADILADLYFADGDSTSQCAADESRAAFTETESRVVHVCGKRFARFAANPAPAEILLIHELLHALGLGENPPTSGEITTAVRHRCGR